MNLSSRSARLSAAVLVLSLASTGCGTVFGGTRQVVRVTSSPANAAIVTQPATTDYVTPASMSLQRKQNYSLALSAPGYTTRTVEIQREMRVGILVLDIVFGLVPVIVDAATGGWYRLSPSLTEVTLIRTTAGRDQPLSITVSLSTEDDNSGTRIRATASAPGVRMTVSPR